MCVDFGKVFQRALCARASTAGSPEKAQAQSPDTTLYQPDTRLSKKHTKGRFSQSRTLSLDPVARGRGVARVARSAPGSARTPRSQRVHKSPVGPHPQYIEYSYYPQYTFPENADSETMKSHNALFAAAHTHVTVALQDTLDIYIDTVAPFAPRERRA